MANLCLQCRCGFVYGYALLLLTTTFILPTALTVTVTSPLPAPTAAAHVQAYGDDRLSPQQHHNIINALIGSGDFGNWGKILSTTDPSMFPLSATLFVPGDSGFSSFSANRLSSYASPANDPDPDPTAPHILITNNSRSNFTLNYRSRLTHPDLFSNPTVAVHGIGDALDYTNGKYNNNESSDMAAMPQSSVAPRREQEDNSPEESLQPPLPDQKKPGASEIPRLDNDVQVAQPAWGNGIAKSRASHSVISGSDNLLILCLGWLLGFLIKIQFR
ncbi:hypothetical protein CRG98_007555 [Punica granatum]|uniref:FAS1 domain-containing protein n=1 Tax=Punica granatum TaxID=22663 RepID=A0A2I0KUQ4_PUNGR|nr:hypothetical protein CRG98_007555 [Punica granatum]